MPIREEKLRLIDDTRSFAPQDITAVWEWLDSFDAQPLRPRNGATLVRGALTFRLEEQCFRDQTYSVAKCSDGRELIGSLAGVAARSAPPAGASVLGTIRDMFAKRAA